MTKNLTGLFKKQLLILSKMAYEKRIGETFDTLGTKPEEWSPCEISGFHEYSFGQANIVCEPVFSIPDGYTFVKTRFTVSSMSGMQACNLCGHPIVHLYYIKHDAKKWVMLVGSECVSNYVLAIAGCTMQQYVKRKYDEHAMAIAKPAFDNLCKKLDDAIASYTKLGFFMPRLLFQYRSLKRKGKLDNFKVRKMVSFIKRYHKVLKDADVEFSYKQARIAGAV